MQAQTLVFTSDSPERSAALAVALGPCLRAGDVILLEGPVGAGKTHFSRSLIQSLLAEPEDVPSPTFTLVQTYETARGMLLHADLYRIGATSEIEELGLTEAFDSAICLVEWPDRLGDLAPVSALTLSFSDGATETDRKISATWSGDRWTKPLAAWRTG